MSKTKPLNHNINYEIDKYFDGSLYRMFIYLRSYSRWRDDLGRRECWQETVERYMSYMRKKLGKKLPEKDYDEVKDAILHQRVMPSMRLMWSAGDAAEKNPATAYNCWYIAVDNLKRFREILFLLCSGCGVGFSVESKYVSKLPTIEKKTGYKLPKHTVEDSREGWADAIDHGIKTWYDGGDVEFDFGKVRPFGSRLKTFGGRSSGPGPLRDLLLFTRNVIQNAQGRKLTSLEVHDISTKIGEIVVAGGTRRSAMISLSDLHDEQMKLAKYGNWYVSSLHRRMANNSAAYDVKPSQQEFMREWISLMESGSGERGIFNREGSVNNMPQRRKDLKYGNDFGGNPCMEILLRSAQACNLTSVVCRKDDTLKTLMDKVRIATILGTYQSSLTDFNYLTNIWKENCDAERLLGVSLNGQFDCEEVRKEPVLKKLKQHALETNQKYAKLLKINESSSITCTKPEGTTSALLDCASGAHPRYAKYYIRRVRISANDPLYKLMSDAGFPKDPEVGQAKDTATTWVFSFPTRAPAGAITRNDITAIDQLEHWKRVKTLYTEHTVSSTIYIGKDEWIKVANWLWENWDIISGLSFLPKEDEEHTYELAPYEEISKDKYEELSKKIPKIDFTLLSKYELDDETDGAREAACVAGACDIV